MKRIDWQLPVGMCGLLVAVWLLAACSSTQQTKNQAVLLKLKTDTKTAVIMGCKDLPGIEVAVSTIETFIPPDPKVLAGEAVATIVGTDANLVCAKVLAAQNANAPVPASK